MSGKVLYTIPWTELEPDTSGREQAPEWNTYLQLVGQLLTGGHENRWVLIVGEELVGIWETEDEARAKQLESYLMTPVLIKQVLSREPVYRAPNFFFRRRWAS